MDSAFGDHLDHLVRRRGLTMAAFAQLVGLSASSLSRIRHGQRQPTAVQAERWSEALKLGREDRARFTELAMLARTPQEVLTRLAQAEHRAAEEQERRSRVERDFTAYRQAQDYYDGFWLSYSYSFRNDGRVQRSLLQVEGERAQLKVLAGGELRYSYVGSFEVLGDKAFVRLAEDRGGVEYVQITLQTLFDLHEPTFLNGLVCGISGKDVRQPVSYPAAARILLLHAGRTHGERLDPYLGVFAPEALTPCWVDLLGDDRRLRAALGVEPAGDLDAAILGMLGNRLGPDDSVLRGGHAPA